METPWPIWPGRFSLPDEERPMADPKKPDDDKRPDRLDHIEARLKRLEQQLGLGPLDVGQFIAEWHARNDGGGC
jgi:hypothetical protein